MVAIPTQKGDISQTRSLHAEQQNSDSGSAGSVLGPPDRAPLGVHYYLTEGLEGVEPQHYKGIESFRTAINSQADQLCSGKAGQYAVFSRLTQAQFANIDRFCNTNYKSLRFLYYEKEETLIVKIMPGNVDTLACTGFELELYRKLTAMELQYELRNMRDTTYHGISNAKEADSSFKPLSFRPSATDWPTLAIEHGVSQSIKALRAAANWWFENSMGQVKIILLFSISDKKRKIHIEQWEMEATANLQIRHGYYEPDGLRPKCISTIEIVEGDAQSASLQLGFQNLFLREPGQDEVDMIFTPPDLERFAACVWPVLSKAQFTRYRLGLPQTTLCHQVRSFSGLARQVTVKDQDRRYCIVSCRSQPSTFITCNIPPSPASFYQFPQFSTIPCHSLPLPASSRSSLPFSAVLHLPLPPLTVLQRHLPSLTRNCLTSLGPSSFTKTTGLQVHGRGQKTLCRPLLTEPLRSLPSLPHRHLGPLRTLCLALFPIGTALYASTVS